MVLFFVNGLSWINSIGPIINLTGGFNGAATLYTNLTFQALTQSSNTVIISGSWARLSFMGRYQTTFLNAVAFDFTLTTSNPTIFQSVVAVTVNNLAVGGTSSNTKVYGYLLSNNLAGGSIIFTTGSLTFDPTVV